MRYIAVSHCLIFLLFLNYAASSCLFPSDLTGQWHTSNKGVLNLASNSTATYIDAFPTTKFGNVKLTCEISSGSQYVFKSDAFLYFGLTFEAYVCFYLSSEISSSKYIYYFGSTINTDADDDRIKVLIQSSTTITTSSVCDRATYPAGSANIFLKNDGNEANSKISCPDVWKGSWSYVFTSGSTSYCSSGSSVDICSSPDDTTVVNNYTTCATVQAYSAAGTLYCMYYTSDSSYTYLYTYNTDTSTDEITTFRFTCYVMTSTNSSILLATQYPQECESTQTPTNVSSPGAYLVYTLTASCPSGTTSSDVVTTASTAGLVVGMLLLIIIVVCGVLVWYYYKKRKEKEKLDKMPLQKAQPANKRLVSSGMFKDVKIRQPSRNSKTPRTMTGALTPVFTNGDVKVNIDADPSVRRENSICISVQSRGAPGFGDLESEKKFGRAPTEEPDKVNEIIDEVIIENDNEATLASTFLPISPHEKNVLNYTDDDIKEIAKKDKLQLVDVDNEVDDMDKIDDELGLPRLSGAFTPIMRLPEIPSLPPVSFRKSVELQVPAREDSPEKTAAGVVKVKLKKNKKKKRVTSAKANLKGSISKSQTKTMMECIKDSTPFLDRIKQVEDEKADLEHKREVEMEFKRAVSVMKHARLTQSKKDTEPTPSSKYLVDHKRSKSLQSANKGSVNSASGDQRRRFGDPPSADTRKNRRKTPRLRHPMEDQGKDDANKRQVEGLQKKEEFWKEEKRQRSGRRREHPEALTIPSVKEDPFDYRDKPSTSAISSTRFDRSANGLRLDREHSAFIDPPKELKAEGDVWEKAANMWLYKHQPQWGNLAHR